MRRPLERTLETAAPIARACGLRVRTHDGLVECDFGRWTGRKLQHLRQRKEWVTVQRHPSGFRFPGGESFAEMQARALDAVTAIAARHRGGTVVAVSHADVIKAVVGGGDRNTVGPVPADSGVALLSHRRRLLSRTGRSC